MLPATNIAQWSIDYSASVYSSTINFYSTGTGTWCNKLPYDRVAAIGLCEPIHKYVPGSAGVPMIARFVFMVPYLVDASGGLESNYGT
jgi:hypothetical protein